MDILDLSYSSTTIGAPTEARTIRVYTDGACSNNGRKNAQGGVGVYFPDGEFENVSVPYLGSRVNGPKNIKKGAVTNQRAELEAILIALEIVVDSSCYSVHDKVEIYTDSEYCISCLTNWVYTWWQNNWKTRNGKPVKNRDLIEPIVNLMRKLHVIYFHIPAHTGKSDERSRFNAVADELAVAGRDMPRT